jgi:hypothetical protein
MPAKKNALSEEEKIITQLGHQLCCFYKQAAHKGLISLSFKKTNSGGGALDVIVKPGQFKHFVDSTPANSLPVSVYDHPNQVAVLMLRDIKKSPTGVRGEETIAKRAVIHAAHELKIA